MAYLHITACRYAELCIGNQPFDFRLSVAVYTWLTMAIDDTFLSNPELQSFTLRFGRGESQGHPVIECLARILKFEAPKFFGSCVTSLFITSTIDAINGHLIESEFPHGFPHSMSSFSVWMRAKSGRAEAYGYFVLSEREFPESEWLGRYIQGVPNIRDVITYTNDILSFYKERVFRRDMSLVSTLAEENAYDDIVSLKDFSARTVAMDHDVRRGYGGEGGALLKAYDSYIDDYIKWHIDINRYHLDKIGIDHQATGHCVEALT